MSTTFEAIAFDLDGTLYPNFAFYRRLVPFLLTNWPLLAALGKARTILRGQYRETGGAETGLDTQAASFYDEQARLMAAILHTDPAVIKDRLERRIYRGWEPIFTRVGLFPHVIETLSALRGAGLKLGLLSDFPPGQKLENLSLGGFWDTVLCSEEIGRLKPDGAPFRRLAQELSVAPERILYVGNSVSYDVAGARSAGMKTALKTGRCTRKKAHAVGTADFVFDDYRQLRAFILE